jgi:hypothetical protein
MNRLLACTLGLATMLVTVDRAIAIAGIEGTFEYSFDAPWRIEPNDKPGGGIEYGPIPIHFAIHDGDLSAFTATDPILEYPGFFPKLPAIRVDTDLGEVCDISIRTQAGASTIESTYTFADLAEVEATFGRWPPPNVPSDPLFRHQICRAWDGENCSALRFPSFASEWHATLWHVLRPDLATPGADVVLTIRLRLVKSGSHATCETAAAGELTTLISDNRVHLGEAPLPRFDERWLYGDLHYHSQGTDNEGESGHSYRGVVRAMGSMGLDFLFATDHASNSTQIMDSDLRHIDIRLSPPLFEFDGIEVGDTLRDTSADRFAFCHALLHEPEGVNAEAAVETVNQRPPQDFLSHGVFPRIFLGGEVDSIPEIREPILDDLVAVPFGNDLGWYPSNLCGGQPADNAVRGLNSNVVKRALGHIFDLVDWIAGEPSLSDLQCDLDDIYETTPTGTVLRDFQGIDAMDYGRVHLVYLPRDATDPNAFVASDTGEYGGAGRRLADEHQGRPALLPELESHGFFFAAHPLSGTNHRGGNGPDGTPWSDFLLEKAFRSSAFLGLQFWNEDTRLVDKVAPWGVCTDFRDGNATRPPGGACSDVILSGPHAGSRECTYPCLGGVGSGLGSAHQYGYARVDVIAPTLFGFSAGDPAHLPVDTPRAGFETGLFHLSAPGIQTGLWERSPLAEETMLDGPVTVEFMLHHGAFTWDRLIHWGMDARRTTPIEWLSAVEPRRVFMAGGSDAHGDLNHREEGYFLGATAITDTAIGKPRNLVEMPAAGSSHSQAEVVGALASGNFAITDGPALRIAIDVNENGIIDPGDAPMGSVFEQRGASTARLLVEWLSSSEFGGVRDIDLYVGARSTAGDLAPDSANRDLRIGPTYAPIAAGPYSVAVKAGLDPSNPESPIMVDHYWRDPTADANGVGGILRILPHVDQALSGVASVELDLAEFPASCCVADVCQTCPADRHYVRAFAETVVRDAPGCMSGSQDVDLAYRRGDCIRRYAYTNPIWIQDTSQLCGAESGVDTRPPVIECNAPDTIAPNDAPAEFEATARDDCGSTVEIVDYECFSFTKKGKKVDRKDGHGGCAATLEGAVIRIGDTGGVNDHVRWTVAATDEAGNTSQASCQVSVVLP